MTLWPFNLDIKYILGNSFFGAAELNENADTDRYSCSRYVIRLNRHGFFCQMVVSLVKM